MALVGHSYLRVAILVAKGIVCLAIPAPPGCPKSLLISCNLATLAFPHGAYMDSINGHEVEMGTTLNY